MKKVKNRLLHSAPCMATTIDAKQRHHEALAWPIRQTAHARHRYLQRKRLRKCFHLNMRRATRTATSKSLGSSSTIGLITACGSIFVLNGGTSDSYFSLQTTVVRLAHWFQTTTPVSVRGATLPHPPTGISRTKVTSGSRSSGRRSTSSVSCPF